MRQILAYRIAKKKIIEKSRETLAGRLCILRLYGLSYREKRRILDPEPLVFSMECLMKRKEKLLPPSVRGRGTA